MTDPAGSQDATEGTEGEAVEAAQNDESAAQDNGGELQDSISIPADDVHHAPNEPAEVQVESAGDGAGADDTDDDEGYEPDTTQEPDEVDPNDLPDGDSGDFDGASIDEDEAPGEAQPDEPMTREESE